MTSGNDDDAPAGYASPPCYMHELDPAYAGLSPAFDPRQWNDVMRWRTAERERLIAERLAVDAARRGKFAEKIAEGLNETIGRFDGLTISTFWPFRGEPDLRPWMEDVVSHGGRCALPIVVEKAKPLIFRCWAKGDPLDRGVWNIPIPASGAEVMPDIVIAPLVGFDPLCYRLGYGGGFFDRTIAAMPAKPRIIGVGYTKAALATIYPQPHDIPMDVIVTERDILFPVEASGAAI